MIMLHFDMEKAELKQNKVGWYARWLLDGDEQTQECELQRKQLQEKEQVLEPCSLESVATP